MVNSFEDTWPSESMPGRMSLLEHSHRLLPQPSPPDSIPTPLHLSFTPRPTAPKAPATTLSQEAAARISETTLSSFYSFLQSSQYALPPPPPRPPKSPSPVLKLPSLQPPSTAERRLVKCHLCGKVFSGFIVKPAGRGLSLFALVSHVMGHHLPKDLRPYQCSLCDNTFRSRILGRTHLKKCHPGDLQTRVHTLPELMVRVWDKLMEAFEDVMLSSWSQKLDLKRRIFIENGA